MMCTKSFRWLELWGYCLRHKLSRYDKRVLIENKLWNCWAGPPKKICYLHFHCIGIMQGELWFCVGRVWGKRSSLGYFENKDGKVCALKIIETIFWSCREHLNFENKVAKVCFLTLFEVIRTAEKSLKARTLNDAFWVFLTEWVS